MTQHGFNFDKLVEISDTVTRNLNKVIDKTTYPVKEARLSNIKHRPIGIGLVRFAPTKMEQISGRAWSLWSQQYPDGGRSSQIVYHLYKCTHLRQSMLELRAVPNVPDAPLRAVPGATDRLLRAVPIADALLLRAVLIAADVLLRAVLLTEWLPTACSVLATDMFAVR